MPASAYTVHHHYQTKEPAYPLDVPVLVRLSSWKHYRAGKIIIDGYNNSVDKTTPHYCFIQRSNNTLYQLHISVDQAKFPDGKVWNCEYAWYSPRSTSLGNGFYVEHPLPDGLPSSLEEAMLLA